MEVQNYDKIVLKFHKGDWIVNKFHDICLITDIDLENGYYICESNRFGNTDGDIDLTDKSFHLWTITDAKDGDVLYSSDSNQPFIYKCRNNGEQVTCYCGINKFGKFFIWNTKDCIITLDKYVPATKEQRDLLFKKMKEAGWEWDAEKKELRKIEKQGKPKWSEDDEHSMQNIESILFYDKVLPKDTCVRLHKWLKSLKQRMSE